MADIALLAFLLVAFWDFVFCMVLGVSGGRLDAADGPPVSSLVTISGNLFGNEAAEVSHCSIGEQTWKARSGRTISQADFSLQSNSHSAACFLAPQP